MEPAKPEPQPQNSKGISKKAVGVIAVGAGAVIAGLFAFLWKKRKKARLQKIELDRLEVCYLRQRIIEMENHGEIERH